MVDIVIILDNKLNNNSIKKESLLNLGGSDRQFTLSRWGSRFLPKSEGEKIGFRF